jgi:hypothetical protein
MPICPNCGSSVAVGESQCPNCHAPQFGGQPPQGFQPPPGAPPQQQYGYPPQGPPSQYGPPQPQYGQQGPYPNYGPQQKSHTTALLLCFFLGGFGIHRFYVGKIGTGVLMLLTYGLCGIMVVYDFLVLCFGTFRDSNGQPLEDKNSTLCIILFIIFALMIIAAVAFFIFALAMLPFGTH